MTAAKSVISINVEDGPFKAFAAAFGKYRNDLKAAAQESAELAAATKKATEAEAAALEARKKALKTKSESDKSAAKDAKEAAAIATAEAAALKKKGDESKKLTADRKKTRDDDIKGAKEMAKWTADVAKNIASGAVSLGKWLTFGAIASGFGLGGLASSASSARRQAQGYGISTGDLRAANVNFSKYVNADSLLANISDAQSDVTKRGLFNSLGQTYSGRSPADMLPELLPKLVEAFRAGGSTNQGFQARGLDKLISIDEVKALASLKPDEMQGTIRDYQNDRARLANEDETNRTWQDFLVSMHRAGQTIEVSLIKNLQALTPYLKEFADGIAKAIDAFVSSGQLKDWIKAVGDGLQRLGKYLGSKEFATDVEAFLSAIHTMAKFLGKLFPSSTPDEWTQKNVPPVAPDAKAVGGLSAAAGVYKAVWDHLVGNDKLPMSVRNNNPGNLRVPGSTTEFQKFGSENDGLRALINQIGLYENRDHLTTLRGIISKYSPSNENKTQELIANAAKRTGFGADQALDASNIDQIVKVVLAITKQENVASSYTQQQIKVLVQNQTGGSAQASIAGIPQ